ncbi:uncharacterized protein LOC131618180 [Vicia villosa]|uniref:uncharacterized protein LOC131618180 n=1 Tax=Vicia villosa TaxID=3911 RepID=UPI00273AF7D8|nr:uncharacterized protein LOC131618180 [Vicia villosa]
MARATGLLPLFSTTMVIMIILFLGLEKAIAENVKMDTAKYSTTRGSWVPLNYRLTEMLKPCTDNFIGACVPGTDDDASCFSRCKQSGDVKGGFCKTLSYKEPAPHNFCHCYC